MPFITDDGSFCYDIPQDVIRVYVSIRFWPINRLWYFGGGLFLDIWNLRTAIFPEMVHLKRKSGIQEPLKKGRLLIRYWKARRRPCGTHF